MSLDATISAVQYEHSAGCRRIEIADCMIETQQVTAIQPAATESTGMSAYRGTDIGLTNIDGRMSI
jgi:hypothetical protein